MWIPLTNGSGAPAMQWVNEAGRHIMAWSEIAPDIAVKITVDRISGYVRAGAANSATCAVLCFVWYADDPDGVAAGSRCLESKSMTNEELERARTQYKLARSRLDNDPDYRRCMEALDDARIEMEDFERSSEVYQSFIEADKHLTKTLHLLAEAKRGGG